MNFFIELFKVSAIVLFPLLINCIANICYFKGKNDKSFMFQCLLIISSLILSFIIDLEYNYLILFINVSLLIAFIYNHYLTAFVISLITLFTYYSFNYLPSLILINYIISFIIIYIGKYNGISNLKTSLIFTFINSFVISFFHFYRMLDVNTLFEDFIYVLISGIVFYTLIIFICELFEKENRVREMLNIGSCFEEDGKLRKALFKIAHEIKNPLAVCKGYLEMINFKDNNKSLKYIGIVNNEMNRALSLMEDYLNYSNINIESDIMDINMLVNETFESMDELFIYNNVKCVFAYDESEIFIKGDYNRLKQVLVNILKNAVEAKKKDEELVISIKIKVINDNVKIMIEDNGVGMESTELKKLGEDFFTTKNNGTGLGVSISKEIIDKHNGKMKYESIKDEYTKVSIIMPLYED